MARKKVTDAQILEALEEKEATTSFSAVAVSLGITQPALHKRMKKLVDTVIPEYVKQQVKKYAIEQINNLRKNAAAGDTKASQLLLEMAGQYTQKQEVTVDNKGIIQVPAKVPVGTPISDADSAPVTGLTVGATGQAASVEQKGNDKSKSRVISLKR